MKNAKFYRFSHLFSSNFKNFWLRFKSQIIIFSIIFIISFIIGIILASKFGDSLELDRMANNHFIRLISLELSVWSYFLINLIFFFIGFVFGYLLSGNLFITIINFIFVILIGYLLGFDTVVCLVNFTFLSRIFFIIFYLLLNLVLDVLLCVIFAIGLKKYLTIKKYGKYCPLNTGFNNYLFIIFFIIVLILLLQCICLNLIHFIYIG